MAQRKVEVPTRSDKLASLMNARLDIRRQNDRPFDTQKRKQAPKGLFSEFGGKGEIRTHGTPKGTPDFESGAFDHSATFPCFPTCHNEAVLSDPSGSLLGRER